MAVKFNEIDAKNIEVLVHGDIYGKLNFDSNQKAWILWPAGIDDGVSYFDNLKETEETIKDELVAFDKEN